MRGDFQTGHSNGWPVLFCPRLLTDWTQRPQRRRRIGFLFFKKHQAAVSAVSAVSVSNPVFVYRNGINPSTTDDTSALQPPDRIGSTLGRPTTQTGAVRRVLHVLIHASIYAAEPFSARIY